MSQIDVDQRNTNALIATAIMYQKQRNDLLAVAEKIARWACTNEIKEGGGFDFFAEELVPELFPAIAAARGEK